MEKEDLLRKLLFLDSLKIIDFMFKEYPKAEISETDVLKTLELAVDLNTIFRKNEVKK